MIETDSTNKIIESVIDDNELIIYVTGCFSLKTIGVPAKEFTPEFESVSLVNRVCVDLSRATRLDTVGLDYLNKYYYAAKEAKLDFRVTGASQLMILLFSMAGVSWPFRQRKVRTIIRRVRRRR